MNYPPTVVLGYTPEALCCSLLREIQLDATSSYSIALGMTASAPSWACQPSYLVQQRPAQSSHVPESYCF